MKKSKIKSKPKLDPIKVIRLQLAFHELVDKLNDIAHWPLTAAEQHHFIRDTVQAARGIRQCTVYTPHAEAVDFALHQLIDQPSSE